MDACWQDREGAPLDASTLKTLLANRDFRTVAARLGLRSPSQPKVELDAEARETWGITHDVNCRSIEVLGVLPGLRLLGVEQDGSQLRSMALRRRTMLSVARQNPLTTVVWWWIDDDEVSFAVVDHRVDGGPYVCELTTALDDPDEASIEAWLEAGAHPHALTAGDDLRKHFVSLVSRESLTNEFYLRFSAALDRLKSSMEGGPDERERRHEIALSTLLRLLFVYFLQREGLLADDRRFVSHRLARARRDGTSFYRGTLVPLFFGALNSEPEHRGDAARELGEIPFLNGGLFEPRSGEGPQSDVDWPNAVWSDAVDALFERYHFRLEESGDEDESASIDAEMLGKVFERLMYGSRRKRSGSFYTPKSIVTRMVEEALGGHIADAADIGRECAVSICRGEPVGDEAVRLRVRAALEGLSILDPAVGTGAFLVEALRCLRRAHSAVDPTWRGTPDELARLIHDHLYGADINYTAVRLCELRLWLAVVSAARSSAGSLKSQWIEPLPNLAHRIVVGDSLVGASPEHRRPSAELAIVESIDRLEHAFLSAHGAEKQTIRQRLEQLRGELRAKDIEADIAALEARLEPLTRAASSNDLFGQRVQLAQPATDAIAELNERRDAALDELDALRRGSESRRALDFASRFPRVSAAGGFDVVLTNPPWVRANALDRERRRRLSLRFGAHTRPFDGSDALGISAPYGLQFDLAGLFLERCVQLCRPNGRVLALVPAKLLRSLHGSGARRVLAECTVERIEDFSDASSQLFDATTYPCLFSLRRATPRGSELTTVVRWTGDEPSRWTSSYATMRPWPTLPDGPMLAVPPELREAMDAVRRACVPFGSTGMGVRRGVLTGANDVFLAPRGHWKEVLGDDRWTRPCLGGRAVGGEPTLEIVWPFERGRLARSLPQQLEAHFERAGARLEARSGHRAARPLWQLFRVSPELEERKVVWRDMSPLLEAFEIDPDVVPLNTVYFVPCSNAAQSRRVKAWFNHPAVRVFARLLAERARGGWRRHFAWLVRLLPVPPGYFDSDHTQLDFDLDEPALERLTRWLSEDLAKTGAA